MSFKDRITRTSPWTVITLAGCAGLVLVGYWREQASAALPFVHGTLPNLVAVPTLTFGFLMLIRPERQPHTHAAANAQRRQFWSLWVFASVATVAWEFMQLRGRLVFDPLDLVATGLGAVAAIALFRRLRQYEFTTKS